MSLESIKIAFLSSFQPDDSMLRGAVLVTDVDTKPLEFRVTEPIRPTSFQKTLYGDVLYEHIFVEIIGVPLLTSLNEQFDIVVVQEPLFLGISSKRNAPVVRIRKDDEPQASKSIVTERIEGITYFVLEASKEFDDLTTLRQQLSPVFNSRDIFEPFKRIRAACDQLSSNNA